MATDDPKRQPGEPRDQDEELIRGTGDQDDEFDDEEDDSEDLDEEDTDQTI